MKERRQNVIAPKEAKIISEKHTNVLKKSEKTRRKEKKKQKKKHVDIYKGTTRIYYYLSNAFRQKGIHDDRKN